MTKFEFENRLRKELGSISKDEQDRLIKFYDEIFLDKAENGYSEEDIVSGFDAPEKIAENYLKENFSSPVKDFVESTRSKVKRIKKPGFLANKTFWIVYFSAFVITFPLTGALIGVAGGLLGVLIGLAASLFAIFVSLYATSISLIAAGIWVFVSTIFGGPANLGIGLAGYGIGIVSIGIGFMLLAASVKLTKLLFKKRRKVVNE